MGSLLKDHQISVTPRWGSLPTRVRALFITGYHRTGGWLAEAFASDSASEVILEEAVGMAAGLARLRDDVFDAILISHEPGDLNALELLEALRAGSGDDLPTVVLGEQSAQEMDALCYEVGADAYVCVNTATTRALIWQVARAMERHRLVAENRRMQHEQRHRMQLEHDEATRLLEQQHGLIKDEDGSCQSDDILQNQSTSTPLAGLPEPLVAHYREMLRAYVIMGSGSLSEEMHRLTELLASAGVTPQRAMGMHLHVLEHIVRGLGSRSARHVMNRADLLILEVMINLCSGYRQRFYQHLRPARQLILPGFQEAVPPLFR